MTRAIEPRHHKLIESMTGQGKTPEQIAKATDLSRPQVEGVIAAMG